MVRELMTVAVLLAAHGIATANEMVPIAKPSLGDCSCGPFDLGCRGPAFSAMGNLSAVICETVDPTYYWLNCGVAIVDRTTGYNPPGWPGFGGHFAVLGLSFSPDGRRLAAGGGRLAVITDAGETTFLQDPDFDCNDPAWSPDGSTIACSRAVGGIWSMPVDGGAPIRLTASGKDATWSPDGESIAYQDAGVVWIVAAGGGPARRLTEGTHPAWSPSGTWIAFSSSRAGSPDIWVIARSGGTAVRLTHDPGTEAEPAWADDGRTLAYTRSTPDCNCTGYLTDLPDFTIDVSPISWGRFKSIYRDALR